MLYPQPDWLRSPSCNPPPEQRNPFHAAACRLSQAIFSLLAATRSWWPTWRETASSSWARLADGGTSDKSRGRIAPAGAAPRVRSAAHRKVPIVVQMPPMFRADLLHGNSYCQPTLGLHAAPGQPAGSVWISASQSGIESVDTDPPGPKLAPDEATVFICGLPTVWILSQTA